MVSCHPKAVERYSEVSREPNMSPDYSGAVIPPNVAPLNFRIIEEGHAYFLFTNSEGIDEVRLVQ